MSGFFKESNICKHSPKCRMPKKKDRSPVPRPEFTVRSIFSDEAELLWEWQDTTSFVPSWIRAETKLGKRFQASHKTESSPQNHWRFHQLNHLLQKTSPWPPRRHDTDILLAQTGISKSLTKCHAIFDWLKIEDLHKNEFFTSKSWFFVFVTPVFLEVIHLLNQVSFHYIPETVRHCLDILCESTVTFRNETILWTE